MQDPVAVDRRRTIAIRISLSAGVGVLVAVAAVAAAWREFGSYDNFYPDYVATRNTVWELEDAIRTHYGNTPPGSLAEMRRIQGAPADLAWNDAGIPLDGWGRPLVYAISSSRYTLTSLGRDGKPGGAGLDRDLSNADERVGEVPATFKQFLFAPLARGFVGTCLLSGVVAFALSLRIIEPSDLQGRRLGFLAISLLVTAVGAIFVAFVLAAVHIPNHH